jgi:inhibitor of KinA
LQDEPLIYPLGDSAVSIQLGTSIDERINARLLALRDELFAKPFEGLKDIVVSYSSLSVYYDYMQVRQSLAGVLPVFDSIKKLLLMAIQASEAAKEAGQFHRVPVCYEPEFAPDLNEFSGQKGLDRNEVIALHTANAFRVYMIGFLPGFPYLGITEARISAARKQVPVQVRAGSIGLAGQQTGIYPFDSPGGWQIIGRTPLQIFDAGKEKPALFSPGDTIQFYSISREEYGDWINQH